MKIRLNKIIYAAFSFLLVLNSCGTNKTTVLPVANIDKDSFRTDSINTVKNEVAPYRLLRTLDCEETAIKEFAPSEKMYAFSGIRPSYKFFEDMNVSNSFKDIIEYFTNNVESVSFLNETEGIVSLSHPPMREYAKFFNFDLSGSKGGTDIFYFKKENGKLSLSEIGADINSKFWDSHPFVGNDSNCNVVLVWASDRNAPYSRVMDVDGNTILNGHTDLYYCFGKLGEEEEIQWGGVKSFGSAVNMKVHNELSPYIVCLNKDPKLLFSSNRNGNYDIYRVPITVDFDNQQIYLRDTVESVPNVDSSSINSTADELFPFIAEGYDGKVKLFISSNRNSKGAIIGDKEVKSKGGYDIYQFEYPDACEAPVIKPPTIKLNVLLVDVVTGREVLDPVISITDERGDFNQSFLKPAIDNYELNPGDEYFVSAYSSRALTNCKVKDANDVKQYYLRDINKIGEIVKKRDIVVEYDTIIGGTPAVRYDTTYTTEYCQMQNIENRYKTLKNDVSETFESKISIYENIVEMKTLNSKEKASLVKIGKLKANDKNKYSQIKIRTITKKEWLQDGKHEIKNRKLVVYDTIPQYDTNMVKANSPEGIKLATRNINIGHIDKDTTIKMVVELYPKFYDMQPCEYVFDPYKLENGGGFPYFQTAYWEVNTKKGLEKYLSSLREGFRLNNIHYIELHPNNSNYRVYGPIKVSREERKKQYREYAQSVDANLREMSDMITKEYIPTLDSVDINNKIYVKIEAWSDKRDAGKCFYKGDGIEYIQGYDDEDAIYLNDIVINDGASLDTNNANLSKLRVYYGWKEIEALLNKDPKYREYIKNNMVFYPTQQFNDEFEMQEALDNARIIILAEGKQADPRNKNNILDYDPIRRITMTIKMIRYEKRRLLPSECCDKTKERVVKR